ncbi:MAG: hypothetical protein GTN82_38855, partial [Candidatus Aminicenantes bacterium]|nr:hypothetical protein [Candidatus Aminicenantes bacterium]
GSIDEDIAESLQSIHKLYHDKLQIVNDWEKRIVEQYGKTDLYSIELKRKLVDEYFDEEYPKIEALEKELRDEIARLIRNHRNRSIWTPITFNNLLCSELSSRGYDSYLEFLDHNIKKHREFTRFWINMVYYVHHEDRKLENFFKKEGENIFRGTAKLPENVLTGILLHLFYIAVLFAASLILFYHSLDRVEDEEEAKLGVLDLKIKKNKPNAWKCDGDTLIHFLYRLFSGRVSQLINKGRVLLDKVDILYSSMQHNFMFLCHWKHFPGDIKVRELISFFASLNNIPRSETADLFKRPQIKSISSKVFGDLKKREKFTAVLALTYLFKTEIYLLDDISNEAPAECAVELKDRIDELHRDGAVVILITHTDTVTAYESDGDSCYEDGKGWFYHVEGIRRALETRKQKQSSKPEEEGKEESAEAVGNCEQKEILNIKSMSRRGSDV